MYRLKCMLKFIKLTFQKQTYLQKQTYQQFITGLYTHQA